MPGDSGSTLLETSATPVFLANYEAVLTELGFEATPHLNDRVLVEPALLVDLVQHIEDLENVSTLLTQSLVVEDVSRFSVVWIREPGFQSSVLRVGVSSVIVAHSDHPCQAEGMALITSTETPYDFASCSAVNSPESSALRSLPWSSSDSRTSTFAVSGRFAIGILSN